MFFENVMVEYCLYIFYIPLPNGFYINSILTYTELWEMQKLLEECKKLCLFVYR